MQRIGTSFAAGATPGCGNEGELTAARRLWRELNFLRKELAEQARELRDVVKARQSNFAHGTRSPLKRRACCQAPTG